MRSTSKRKAAPKSSKSIERAFARALDFEVIGAPTRSYAEVSRRLRNLEKHYTTLLAGDAVPRLEIQRRISEQRLEQALLHGCSLAVCRRNLDAAYHLGFTNIEREAHFVLLYARGALARGHKFNCAAHRLIHGQRFRELSQKEEKLARSTMFGLG